MTVISDRAGLVMNNDAKVKMRGVVVGKVESIESRPDGKAASAAGDGSVAAETHPVQREGRHHVVNGVRRQVSSKWSPPIPIAGAAPRRSGDSGRARHGRDQHRLPAVAQVLDKIDPAKLNQTLGAVSKAFNGRGEKFGKTLTDFNAFLAKIEPSLPNLSHDLETAAPTLGAYADAAPDLARDRP